jgi:dihydrofolate synthase/folylpolyglutamate synthase
MNLLGDPQDRFPSVQISGTSGKGSTAYLLSHILATAGYKTGLSISPHLERLNERMQVNEQEIPDEKLISLVNRIVPIVAQMKAEPLGEPSYFELLLGIAFLYFAEEQVAIAIIEVGIEGKYDATNILKPLLTVLTNISLDHTHILGGTEEKIAREAVSIVREGTMLITGVTQPELLQIVRERCRAFHAPLKVLGEDFSFRITRETRDGLVLTYTDHEQQSLEVFVSLTGHFQGENTALALASVKHLRSSGYDLLVPQLKQALATASFPGRFELMRTASGEIILDGAHNPAKLKAFIAALERLYPGEKKVFLVAFKKHKEIADLVRIIRPAASRIIFTEFQQTTDLSMRAATPWKELMRQLKETNDVSETDQFIPSSTEALEVALGLAQREQWILVVTGSLYLVGEIRQTLKKNALPAA